MHEASIAVSLLDSIGEIARRENAREVVRVRLKVGKLSGIVVDSLVFVFDVLKKNYRGIENATLEVQEVPIRYRCRDCGTEFEVDDFYFPECKKCGSINLDLISGEELEIVDVEIDV